MAAPPPPPSNRQFALAAQIDIPSPIVFAIKLFIAFPRTQHSWQSTATKCCAVSRQYTKSSTAGEATASECLCHCSNVCSILTTEPPQMNQITKRRNPVFTSLGTSNAAKNPSIYLNPPLNIKETATDTSNAQAWWSPDNSAN